MFFFAESVSEVINQQRIGAPVGFPVLLMLWVALFTGLSFLLPNHYSPWLAFQEEWCAALAVAPVIVWALMQQRPSVPVLAWVAWVAGVFVAMQWITGLVLFRGDAAMVLLYWWGFALAIVAGATLVKQAYERTKSPLNILAPMWLAVILACVVSLGVVVHQWLDLSLLEVLVVALRPGHRPYGNLAQPNQLSTLFFLGLMGTAFLFEASRIGALAGTLSAAVMCLGLVITQSRSALLIIVWLLIAFFFLRRRSSLRIHPAVPIAFTGAYVGLSLAWPAINHWLLISDSAIRAIDRTTAGQRAIYWRSMLDAIADHPWWGFGFQQLNMAQRATALDYPATYGFFESSHNLVLDLMGWAGVPFALIVLGCAAVWFVGQWRSVSDGMAWATLATLGVFGVHSMVEFPLYYAYFLIPAGIWVGALTAASRAHVNMGGIPSWRPAVRALWSIVALVCASLFVWVSDEYLAWEEDWRTATFEEMGYANTPPPATRKVVLLDQIGDFLWFSRYEAKPGMSEQDLRRAERIAKRESNAMVMFKYAKVAAMNGDSKRALHYLLLYQSLHSKRAYAQARKDWLNAAETWPQLQRIVPPPAEQ